LKTFLTQRKANISADKRPLDSLLMKTVKRHERGFDCILAVRIGDQLAVEGTPAWKEAFDGNKFLEKVNPTPNPDAAAEKNLPESMDPDTLLALKLDPKRTLLSRMVHMIKGRYIWGCDPPRVVAYPLSICESKKTT